VSGSLLLEICTALPRRALVDLGDDSAWQATGSGAEDDSDMLPGTAFTHVGEHLLGLVPDLESFAASSAMDDLRNVSANGRWRGEVEPGEQVDGEGVQALWTTLTAQVWSRAISSQKGTGLTSMGVEALARRCSAKAAVAAMYKSSTVYGTPAVESEPEGGADSGTDGGESSELIALRLANDWLEAIADSIIGLILAQIVRIERLSAQGKRQLRTDLDYVTNVVSAIGLAPHPILAHVSSVLALSEDGASSLRDSGQQESPTSHAESALRELDRRVLQACGSLD